MRRFLFIFTYCMHCFVCELWEGYLDVVRECVLDQERLRPADLLFGIFLQHIHVGLVCGDVFAVLSSHVFRVNFK